jgi:hypothetical protein
MRRFCGEMPFNLGPELLQQNKKITQTSQRQRAIAQVPFSSVFYCSNPLAAILTRRRAQIFYLLVASLARIKDITHFFEGPPKIDPATEISRRLRFVEIERRDGSMRNTSSNVGPSISTFGVMKKNVPVGDVLFRRCGGGAIEYVFAQPVEWDAWYFQTSVDALCDQDPVRFYIQESDDGIEWRTIGSSMAAQVAQTTIFLNGQFSTSPKRLHRHTFRLLRPTMCGYYILMLLGDLQNFGLAVCGFLGRERLGACVPNIQAVCFVLFQLAAAWSARPSEGDCSAFVYVYLAAMQVAPAQAARASRARCAASGVLAPRCVSPQ